MEGVPGYPAPSITPQSRAARATAWLPLRSIRWDSLIAPLPFAFSRACKNHSGGRTCLDNSSVPSQGGGGPALLRSSCILCLKSKSGMKRMSSITSFWSGTESYAEAISYFPKKEDYFLGPEEYLKHIHNVKRAVDIPIIASLNGSTVGGWTDYARGMCGKPGPAWAMSRLPPGRTPRSRRDQDHFKEHSCDRPGI